MINPTEQPSSRPSAAALPVPPRPNLPGALRAMERAGRGAARAVGIELAADLLTQARKLVGGVILTAAEEDLTVLAPLLAVVA